GTSERFRSSDDGGDHDLQRDEARLPALDHTRNLRRGHGLGSDPAALGGPMGRGRQHHGRLAADDSGRRARRRAPLLARAGSFLAAGSTLRAMPDGRNGGALTIAHISDIHCGGPDFVASLLERAIGEINDLAPDVVICSGDLTTFGFKHEYAQARGYMDRIDCKSVVVIPGNHDSRNVGYVHFEDMFGERNSVLRIPGLTVVAVDSTEPDLDHGQIGRGRYRWIEE